MYSIPYKLKLITYCNTKKKKKLTPKAQRGREAADNLCFAATHPSVSIFPTGYIPTHSPTPPTSTLRATRAHDADLLIYSFYRTIKIHRDISSILQLYTTP